MRKSITPNQIKETNRTLIYQYIYKRKKFLSRIFPTTFI